jgi:hypothetical protein
LTGTAIHRAATNSLDEFTFGEAHRLAAADGDVIENSDLD